MFKFCLAAFCYGQAIVFKLVHHCQLPFLRFR